MNVTLGTARQVFEEQIAAFAQRLNLIGTQRFDDIRAEEHYRAFVVAGAMKADLLADLHEAVRKAVVDGDTIQAFRKQFQSIVERHGWHGWTGEGTRLGEAWRTRVIYTTNARKAYSAGRYAQLTDPDMLSVRPYWRWVHSGLAKDPRPEHLDWHGMTLRHDDPFWRTHFPPRIPPDYGCGCRVVAVRNPAAGARTEAPEGWEANADPGAGAPPQDVVADIRSFVEEKRRKLPPELARSYGEVVERYELTMQALHPQASLAAQAAAFVTAALTDRRAKQPSLELGPLPTSFADRTEQIGVRTAGKVFALDHDYMLHILKQHGTTRERLRGQLPVTASDFVGLLAGLSDVVEVRLGTPPRSRNGAARVFVVVMVEGIRMEAVLEVRRNTLVPFTAWKRQT